VLARTAIDKEDEEMNPKKLNKADIDVLPMIGDVNMFFKLGMDGQSKVEAEVEVMIAGTSQIAAARSTCRYNLLARPGISTTGIGILRSLGFATLCHKT